MRKAFKSSVASKKRSPIVQRSSMQDSESCDPGSNPGGATSFPQNLNILLSLNKHEKRV